ncbi:phage holin family protein [Mycobacterium asiaticum]|uniref:Transmembrane protein n=1 Tax=Mycobacterium asiaticum TaxID=1790 RepID=A0A1A3N8M6_MYCAS|nr:phage holin family protein [Mycobacterium asiaticum]OBK16727.1 hypothetical protein A5636_24405 [Mycobacterium asiaticum]
MLIIALVLALIGLVALVFAVVTSNELVAWVCIGASVLGVILLIIDAVRERQHRDADSHDRDEDRDPAEDRDQDEDHDNALDHGESADAVDYPEEADAEPETGAETRQESAPARDEGAK